MPARRPRRSSSRPRFLIGLALGMVVLAPGGAEAAIEVPAWYTPNVGGFNPSIPDFYQHQNFDPAAAANLWEKKGGAPAGWCYPIAVSDVLYDFTKQNYNNLLSPGITNNATWLTTAYGAAGVNNTGDLYNFSTYVFTPGNSVQTYLNKAGTIPGTASPLLIDNRFSVDGNGVVTYTSAAPVAGGAPVVNTASVFDFVNLKERAGDDPLLKFGIGTTANPADRWWTNYHFAAVAGVDVANKTVFVADPNTNKGSEATDTGAYPGAIPAARKFVAGDAIPIPGAPALNNAASYSQFYSPLQLNNKDIVKDLSGAKFSLSNTTVDAVEVVSAAKVGVLFDGLFPNPNNNTARTVVHVGSPTETIDGIAIAPSAQASPLTSLDTINLPGWSVALGLTDPYLNARPDGVLTFLKGSGSDLAAGSFADLTLATLANFAANGFDLFLHYSGNASTDWDVQVYNQNPAPFDVQTSATPEPSSLVLALIGLASGAAVLGRRTLATAVS